MILVCTVGGKGVSMIFCLYYPNAKLNYLGFTLHIRMLSFFIFKLSTLTQFLFIKNEKAQGNCNSLKSVFKSHLALGSTAG